MRTGGALTCTMGGHKDMLRARRDGKQRIDSVRFFVIIPAKLVT